MSKRLYFDLFYPFVLERSIKRALVLMGLKHCTHGDKCVMRDAAETIQTIDHVDLKLCDHCSSLVK